MYSNRVYCVLVPPHLNAAHCKLLSTVQIFEGTLVTQSELADREAEIQRLNQ